MDIKKDIVIRLSLIYLAAALVAVLIVGQTVRLQLSDNLTYDTIIRQAEYREVENIPERGDICAQDGRVLATSLPFYDISMDLISSGMDKDTFTHYLRPLADSLSDFFKDRKPEQYVKTLDSARKKDCRFFTIKKGVSYQDYQRIRKFPLFKLGQFKGGFIAEKKSKRILPYKNLAARTIGSYQNGRYIGIEGSFDAELTGDASEQIYRIIGNTPVPIEDENNNFEPLIGKDIITTLNINYQDFAHHALYEQMSKYNADTGTVILMEVKTGEIKAMVNLTRQDSAKYFEGYNYAVGMLYEPGSTFKLASLMSAMEDGYIDLNDSVQTGNGTVTIRGFTIRESGDYGYGKLSVKQVFEKSSNVGTSLLICNNYRNKDKKSKNKDAEKKFVNRLYSMDINEKTEIELDGEPAPAIKYPDNNDWWGSTLPQMSIGYEIMLTPLQVLNFYNAVANDGVMVKPRLIKAIRDRGKIIKEFHTQVTNPSICSKETIKRAKIMMEGVVKNGTADNIDGGPYKIAGKTGTAQVASGKRGYGGNRVSSHFGSFVGYFPADNPQYSCIVVIMTKDSHHFYGNILAAPVFRAIADKVYASSMNMQQEMTYGKNQITKDVPSSKDGFLNDLEYIYKRLRIPVKGRNNVSSPWVLTKESNSLVEYQNRIVRKNKVPYVIGLGLKDAVYLLESAGLKVIINGRGTIREQSLEAGTPVQKNQTITISLG